MPADHIDAFTRAIRGLGVIYTKIAGQQGASHATLGKQDLLAIGVLGLTGGARMGEVAEHLGIGQSATTPIVDRLETQGLVQRTRSQADRRVWIVELTASGLEVYRDEDAIYRQAATEMMAPLDRDERETVVRLLEKMMATDLEDER